MYTNTHAAHAALIKIDGRKLYLHSPALVKKFTDEGAAAITSLLLTWYDSYMGKRPNLVDYKQHLKCAHIQIASIPGSEKLEIIFDAKHYRDQICHRLR